MKKLTLVAALVAGALAACGGAKQIGYVGASSGKKPNALKIVEVDADTGEIAVRGALPVANATYIAVNRARTIFSGSSSKATQRHCPPKCPSS